jgi:hypothetical protein
MYSCEICTDYIDSSKTEEILQKCAKIISDALRRKAPSGMAVPSGANKNNINVSISQNGGDVNETFSTPVCSIK